MLPKKVLFDLDGTLLDTAPDLLITLNHLRSEYDLAPDITLKNLRPMTNLGSKAMLRLAFGELEEESEYLARKKRFFELYEEHLLHTTTFFPEIHTVLDYLDAEGIEWGIVTNKLTQPTNKLLAELNFLHRPACIVCGDTLAKAKPDPMPLIHASALLNTTPNQCLFVGDAISDVKAGKAAGMLSIIALYGYINSVEEAYAWNADGYIQSPTEIITWVKGLLPRAIK